MAPLGLFVDGVIGDAAQGSNKLAVLAYSERGEARTRRLVHKRHELVRESWHGASDADAADIGTAANTAHPTALGHVAIHHRAPAADFHQALGRAVFECKISLLVISGAVATFMNRLAKQPRRTKLIIERNHGSQTCDFVEEIENSFHEVVGLHWTAGNIHDRKSRFRTPFPSQIISQTHAARGIARHRVYTPVSRASAGSDYGKSFRCETVNPVTSQDRLLGDRVGA